MDRLDGHGAAQPTLSLTDWLIIGCFVLWAAAIAAVIQPLPVLHAPLRIGLTVLAAALATVILRGPSRPLILSPLYVLSLFALVFYSLVPTLYVEFRQYLPVIADQESRILAYTGSLGEMLVLQFTAFCLMFTALTMRCVRHPVKPAVAAVAHRTWTIVALCAAALVLALTAVSALAIGWPALGRFLSGGVGREISHAIVPLISVCTATLAYVAAIRKGRFLVLLALVLIIFLGTKLVTDVVQIPVFITLAALLLLIAVGFGSVRSVALAGVSMLCLVLAVAVIIGGIRYAVFDSTKPQGVSAYSLKYAIVWKLIYRQGDSAWCFNNIAATHFRLDRPGNPLYFASAVVPRVLWPEKPNLSRGKEFGQKFCGTPSRPGNQTVALITLMGEPILEGGVAGLIAAQMFLGIGLFVIAMLAFRRGHGGSATRLIALAAMLPWLAHFQQHFALFFAGAVKTFIIMAPLFIILAYCERRST